MYVEDFLELLDRVKRSGNGWEARCPAHNDRTPSLSVDEGEDGRILVNCHTGCSTEDICDSLGIGLHELFPEPEDYMAERLDKTYDYRDENGKLLFQVLRYRDPKTFKQRHEEGGHWIWNLTGVRRVPYSLPKLFNQETKETVWICEGEKDADILLSLGLVATTVAGGSGSWREEYAEYFAGYQSAFIVGDCDEPGRKYANEVAKSLYGVVPTVKVLDLGGEDGYDIADFFAEHGFNAVEKLSTIADTTNPWSPFEKVQKTLPMQGVKEFLDNVPTYDEDKDYLGAFLHGGYRVHVAGPIGAGKTTFLMEAVSAALKGEDFLGWQGKGGLRALYIDLEMPTELLGQAIRDARLDDEEGFTLVSIPDGLRIDTRQEDREMLEQSVAGFDILVLDPWYKLMEQELDYSAARGITSVLDGIRSRNPNLCTLIGFHAQEPQYPSEKLHLGSISGFKFFQRPADIVLTFQRIAGNTSRLLWLKNRSPRLGVQHNEDWRIEWERGWGFTRTDSVEGYGQDRRIHQT